MNRYWSDLILDWSLSALLFAIIALCVLFGADAIAERSAFDAVVACEAKRMTAHRQILSSRVVCVPAYRETKSDTLTLQGVK
jgi:hypothetical protein